MPTFISVIIPVFIRENVFDTIAFLEKQSYFGQLKIVVVDNGSAPELSARLATLKTRGCEVIRLDRNLGGSGGFTAGVDRAMKHHADTDFVWLLDDDAEPTAEALPELLRTYRELSEKEPRVAAVGSAILGTGNRTRILELGSSINWWNGHFRPFLSGVEITDAGSQCVEADFCGAGSFLISKRVIAECGFFENLFIHYDDVEWCFRIRSRGWKIFATTDSRVHHPEWEGKLAEWIRYYDIRNYCRVCWKFQILALPLFLCRQFPKWFYFVLHGARGSERMIRWGVCDFLTGRLRLRSELRPTVYETVDWAEINRRRQPVLLICRTRERAAAISSQLPDCRCREIIYRTEKSKWLSLACAMLKQLGAQFRYGLTGRRDLVVFDDIFRTNLMLPFLAKEKIFYNFPADKGAVSKR